MGDNKEEVCRELTRRRLNALAREMMMSRKIADIVRLREAIEEVAEEEEGQFGIRGGPDHSTLDGIADCIYVTLITSTNLLNSTRAVKEELLHCLRVVLRRNIIRDYKRFDTLHFHLLQILVGPSRMPHEEPLTEEMKMDILASLSEIFHSAAPEVREQLWGMPYRGKLGHTIYLCLSLSKTETNKGLRLQAIQTVQKLGFMSARPPLTKQERDKFSETFVNFLPGILQAMTKVAKESDIQGSKIIAAAVDTWRYFCTLVMRDSYLSSVLPHLGESNILVNLRRNLESGGGGGGGGGGGLTVSELDEEEEEEETMMEYDDFGQPTLPNTKVTRKWAQSTGKNIGVLATALAPLATHMHWRVRESMCRWAVALVSDCMRSLPSCFSPALDVLFTARYDDMADVRNIVEGVIPRLCKRLADDGGGGGGGEGGGQKFQELVLEKLVSLSIRLPSIVRQEDDATTLGAVRQIAGCLEMLGKRGMESFLASNTPHRLLHSLTLLLSLDTTDSRLLHQHNLALDPFKAPPIAAPTSNIFTHFQDQRILEVVIIVCNSLGCNSDVLRMGHLCVDFLHLHTSAHLYSEGLLLLSMVLDGMQQRATDKNLKDRQHLVQLILDEVLSAEVLSAPLPGTQNEGGTRPSFLAPLPAPSSKGEGARVHVVRVIQALGVVGACAQLIGPNFSQFLSMVLCPVLECVGVGNIAVSQAATNALKRISEATGCADIEEFIHKSTPHLWYPLSMRLKRLTEYPAAPIVLRVTLCYIGPQMQAFTEELVEEALMALDQHHVEAAVPMLRVLLAFVCAVAAKEEKKSGVDEQDYENADYESEGGGFKVQDSDDDDDDDEQVTEEKEKIVIEEQVTEEKEKIVKEEEGKAIDGVRVEGSEEVEERKEGNKERKEENFGAVAKFIQEYHDAKMSVKRGLEEEEKEEEEDTKMWNPSNPPSPPPTPSPPPEPTEPTPPRDIELVRDVVERCSYLLHMEGQGRRLLTLEVVLWGCRALRNWENILLPCTHKLWRPILLLLSQSDSLVGTRTLALMSKLVALSGDFLRRRVLQEALPLVLKFLESQSSICAKDCYAPSFKAQISCFNTLTTLLPPLQLGVTDAGSVIGVVASFLDIRNPSDLVAVGAMKVLRVMAKSHPHHVWLALALRRPPVLLVHPSCHIPAVKIGSTRYHNTLSTKAEELFQELSSGDT